MIQDKRFLRPDEMAEALCLSLRTIYRMIRDGRLQAVKMGGGPWRIPLEQLSRLMGGSHV